ncbi:hypothetical protein Tco_0869653 [Tanacetum coccineum]
MFQDSDFDVLDDDMEDVEGETIHTATTGVSAVSAPVTTAGVAISTAEPRTPPTTAATAFIDEDLTIAQTLIKMKEEKAKEKGVAIKDVEDSPRPIRSITTLQPLQLLIPKDKELAQRLHEEELAELDRAQKERQKSKQEEAIVLLLLMSLMKSSRINSVKGRKEKQLVVERAEHKEQCHYKNSSQEQDDYLPQTYRLVNERYETTSPEGYDLLLWGDLKTLFEPNEEDEIWQNQQDYNLISWRVFD